MCCKSVMGKNRRTTTRKPVTTTTAATSTERLPIPDGSTGSGNPPHATNDPHEKIEMSAYKTRAKVEIFF